jgi:RNA polymerase sigma factor (sigma-70 family)
MTIKMPDINKSSSYSSLRDEELVIIYHDSENMEVIGELYRRYSHLVLGTCFKYLKNKENASDATMQIFEKLITDLKTNRIEYFKSWLYTVSKNHCLMFLRKETAVKQRIEIIRENTSEKFVEICDELHLNHEYDNEKRLVALSQALTKLNDEQRTCVELTYLENKSYKEIAEITGMDINKVKSHIQNGKRNLKIFIEKINDVE